MAQRGGIPAQPGRREGAAGRGAARRLAEELPAVWARARRLLYIPLCALPLKAARMRRGAALLPSSVPCFHPHPYPTPHVSLRVWRHRGRVPIPAPPPPSPPTGRLCNAYAASPARTAPTPSPPPAAITKLPSTRAQRGCLLVIRNAVFVYKVGTSLSERLGARSLVPVPARAEPPSSEAAVRRQLPAALPRGFHNRRSPSRDHCRLSDSCSVPSPGIKHPLTVPSLVGRWAAGKNCKGGEECIN